MHTQALAGVAQLVGASSHRLKGRRFDSWSGHTPRLQVWSQVGARAEWQLINVSLAHQCFSPPLSPCLSFSLKLASMSLGEDKKMHTQEK